VKKINHIAIVLDNSGSMSHLRAPAQAAFNNIVRDIREKALSTFQETRVTLVTFGKVISLKFYNADSQILREMTDYSPDESWTDLWGGVGEAVERLESAEVRGADNSFLLIVVTDGQHNLDNRYTYHSIQNVIRGKQALDNWTFTFQMPAGGAATVRGIGVPPDNIREWEQTERGTREVAASTSIGTQSFYAGRALGLKKMDNFYAQTDLSNVTVQDVKAKLVDISPAFRKYAVDKECSIQSFVEYKTGTPYVIGSGYYQLMKSETVQPQKRVLVMEKGKKNIYGGDAARDLIGIPRNLTCKLTPGNHANFDIFVQSTSVNRKLPRGTQVLVDRTHTQNSQPTWDHVAVQQAAQAKAAKIAGAA
jgi:hypothetical protein